MNRIFKRPMFRKGGTPNEGIMDGLKPPRQKMEMGGVPDAVGGLPEAISKKPGFFQGILEALSPSTGKIVKRAREVQEKPFLFEGIFDPAKESLEFRTPEEQEAFYEKYPDLKLPKTEVKPEEEPLVTPEIEPKPEIKKESDLETVYSDLLPLFQKELGMDADETKRQKYLQLAQFGLGLLAQPGGDLTGAVGRAAQKPLADLQRLQYNQKTQ